MPSKTRTWSLALIIAGAVALVLGFITKGMSSDEHEKALFWGTLMYNSIYFTLICNASMFFYLCYHISDGWLANGIPQNSGSYFYNG